MAASSGGGRFSDMLGKVAIVNHWPLLMRATSDDGNPIPGYMYPEISGLTFESSSGSQQCGAILSFLQDRLAKKSWHVKLKVLQVMKYVTVHGESTFRNILRRQANGIQEATKYNATPDPLHGNAPILAVRRAATDVQTNLLPITNIDWGSWSVCYVFDGDYRASVWAGKKELLKVLFDDSLSMEVAKMPSSGSKMEGFGSVHMSPQKKMMGESILSNLQQLSGAISSAPLFDQDTSYRSLQGHHSPEEPNAPQGIHTSTGLMNASSGSYQPVVLTDEQDQRINELPSQRLGGSTGHVDEPDGNVAAQTSSSSEGHSAGSFDLNRRLETVAVADWSEEVRLATDLTSKTHVSSIPSREEMNTFVKRASSLNCEKIIEILVSRMKSSDDSQVACLCGIEVILREGLVSVECVLPIIKASLPDLQESTNRTVVAKANKIQRQLERDNLPSVNHQSVPAGGRNSVPTKVSGTLTPKQRLFSGMSVNTKVQTSTQPVLGTTTNLVNGSQTDYPGMSVKSLRGNIGGYQGTDLSEETTSGNCRQSSSGGCLSSGATEGSNLSGSAEGVVALSLDESSSIPDLLMFNHQNRTNETLEGMDSLVLRDTPTMTPIEPPSQELLKSPQKVPSSNAPQPTHTSPVGDSATVKTTSTRVFDPLLSRDGHLSDFIGLLDPSPGAHPAAADTRTDKEQVRKTTDTPIGPKEPIAVTNVPNLYPQLAGAKLSSQSSVPLQLGRVGGNSFGFISSESNAGNSSDSFDFVQEALRGSNR